MLHKMVVTTKQTLYCILGSALAFGIGCDLGEEGDLHEGGEPGEVEYRPIGGVWLNTSAIGPLLFSQIDLGGQALDGLTLTGVFIPGPGSQWRRLDTIEVVDGKLRGQRGDTVYSGAALVGSRWHLSPAQGEPVEVRISAYSATSGAPARYTFKTSGPGGQDVYVCDPDAGGDHSAILIKDLTVDHQTGAMAARAGTMYLACLSGAVGKAFKWGYDPEASISDFEAAVRMVRADYCFDGSSWTTVGTSMQVQDIWGPGPFLFPEHATEAVWTSAGLACLTQPRWTVYTAAQVQCQGQPIPSCPADVDMSTYPDALFWTKLGAPL
jgi:hypothetical protein